MDGSNQKGVTLTELIVASMLIGIVMAGVTGFSVTVKDFEDHSQKATLLSMRTATAMHQITKDISLAVGNHLQRGVQTPSVDPVGIYSLCARHDTSLTPEDYTDDEWVCYFVDNSGGGIDNIFYRCNPVADIVYDSDQDGIVGPGFDGSCAAANRRQLINVMPHPNEVLFAPVIISNNATTGRLEYVEIRLYSLWEPTVEWDPVSNPSFALEARISPAGHSR